MFDPWTKIKEFQFLHFYLSLWHIDPATDGTDDSCGWGKSKLTEKEKKKLKGIHEFEKWSVLENFKLWKPENLMKIVFTEYHIIKWTLYRKRMDISDYQYVLDLCLNMYDDLRIYPENPDYEFDSFFWNLARLVKRKHRKWYQHPRWHFHHWKFRLSKGKFLQYRMEKDSGWVRICGKGLCWVDRSLHEPLFSTRNGFRKSYKLGKWGISFIK